MARFPYRNLAELRRVRKHEAKVGNEIRKMRANALNAIGIALAGAGFILPVVRDNNLAALLEGSTWIWISFALLLHLSATILLKGLEPED